MLKIMNLVLQRGVFTKFIRPRPLPCYQVFRSCSSLPPHVRIDYTASEGLQDDNPPNSRTASVALVGPPNAGKSSLSNALIEARVSAVSRKVNTTRNRTTGVYTDKERQLIFFDTPGVIERHFIKNLGAEHRELTRAGWGAAVEADVALLVVDVTKGKSYFEKCATLSNQLVDVRGDRGGNVLVLNKCDLARPRTRLLFAADFFQNNIDAFKEKFEDRVFMVSAYNGKGIRDLRNTLLDMTTEGEFEVEPGTRHCDDDIDLVRQHIWEKFLHRVHNEVPYRSYFENDEFIELPDGGLFVSEIIRVKRASMVSIVVGHEGRTISWIKETAEKSSSEALGRRVHLKLQVKVA